MSCMSSSYHRVVLHAVQVNKWRLNVYLQPEGVSERYRHFTSRRCSNLLSL